MEENRSDEALAPITFYLRQPGIVAVTVVFSVGFGGVSLLTSYVALASEGISRTVFTVFSVVLILAAIGIPIWTTLRSRRQGEVVIDPVCGEIRVSGRYEIPFAKIRQVEVVQHEYTYQGAGPELDRYSIQLRGWAIDIGGGSRLFAENGISRERIAQVAEALRARVEAFRARTGQQAEPLPRPGKNLLKRIAGSLREGGESFQNDWLALDGPIAEWIREYHTEPDARTMGRDGELAQALRKAGFDLGDAPATAPPGDGAR